MSSSKNIVIASHYYPPHVGGIEYVAYNQATELARMGHKVTVLTSKVLRDETSSISDGVVVSRVPAWNPLEKYGVPFPLFGPKLIFMARKLVKEADIVHVHDSLYLSSLITSFWARVYKKPLVVTQHVGIVSHSKPVEVFQKFVQATTGRFIFKSASAVLTLNDSVTKLVKTLGVDESRLHQVSNGVDTSIFHPALSGAKEVLKKRFGLSTTQKIVLFVGRNVPKKGFPYVYANRSSDYQLVFAGGEGNLSGDETSKFLGVLKQRDLSLLFRCADLFVLPSKSEGFPMSVQEAMASGVPIIMSDDEGYARYRLDKKRVVMIKDISENSVGAAIKRVLEDDSLRASMANYSLHYAKANFSWNVLADQLDELYEKLASPAKPLIITTSWDDGHKLDVRLSQLLSKYGVSGTFYISPRDHELQTSSRLTDSEIVSISEQYEIGAHTMTHQRLTKVHPAEAEQEISSGKKYLEDLIGEKITSFCYPGGKYNAAVVRLVRGAGFTYGRTVRRHYFGLATHGLTADTTVNTYNHWSDLWKIARFARFNPARTISYFQWDNLAIAMYDKLKNTGGVFHLWGHSWEIDKHSDWEKLDRVLKYISRKNHASYLTNAQVQASAPQKVLIAAPYFPPHVGGQEFYAYNVAKRLQADHGWDVVIATSSDRGMRTKKSTYDGLTVYRMPYWFKLSNTPLNPLWFFTLRKIIKEQGVDLINAHAPVPYLADIAVKAAGPIPVVVTYHMLSMKKNRPSVDWLIALYERFVLPRTLAKATQVISSSEIIRDSFLMQFRDKTQTVFPGVDIQAFRPGSSVSEHRVLFVGSLDKSEPHKGVSYLLDAAKELIKQYPDLEVWLVGDGSARSSFELSAKEKGLDKNVKFLGRKFGSELNDLYRQAAVFVLPSLNESVGMVLLEAMASGLAIVSTTAGGIPTVIENGKTGYLVPPANSSAIAERISFLLTNPKVVSNLGREGRKKVERELSWPMQASKTDVIFAETLSRDNEERQ